MKNNYLKLLSIVLAVAAFAGCKKGTEDPIAFGYEYFPVDSGRYAQFSVDSIAWDPFISPVVADTFRFEVREQNDSIFTDNTGKNATTLLRYYRDSISGPWYLKDVWYMNRNESKAEKVEENERITKLVFPIKDGVKWNGNALNANDAWDYELTNVGKPYTVNGITFNETVTVLQTGINDIPEGMTEPLLNKQLGKEVYAKGVGLIYKELTILEANVVPNVTQQPPFNQRIKGGFTMTMTLNDYSPQ